MTESKRDLDTKAKKLPSMKEAFESIGLGTKVRKSNGSGKPRTTVRDWLWNYPENLFTFFKSTSPISFIAVFLILGFGIFSFLKSDTLASVFSDQRNEIFVEGSVGAISTFNPLFISQNPVDKDIQALVFEKFVDISIDGNPTPAIATDWVVSKDGKTYDFTISKDHLWQDGEPLTVEDVIFTFEVAKTLASDHGYDTVGSVLEEVKIDKVSDDKVRFTLSETNSTFFEAVSVYIVPEHILGNISVGDIPFNSFAKYPTGSGPYRVYRSEPNVVYLSASNFYRVTPKIETVIYRLYSDYKGLEAAFRNGVLDAVGGIDGGVMSFVEEYPDYTRYEIPIDSRIRMIFFNIRKEKFEGEGVRMALNEITDKEKLLELANIPGTIADGPIASSSWAFSKSIVKYPYDAEKSAKKFKDMGYTRNEQSGYYETKDKKILSFTISYYDNELNSRLVNALKSLWKEEGVVLNLEPLTYTQLTQEIVATRDFELLLYEIETTVDPDQYNLWHSLKSNYPDLNLSGYSYERVDILLEEGRRSIDKKVRKEKYDLFQKYLTQDAPVLFLYHPSYTYVVKDSVKIPELGPVAFPSQRYQSIALWAK